MNELLVGLDLGTTSFKAVACNLDGQQVASARSSTPWNSTTQGISMSPNTIMTTVNEVLERCLHNYQDAIVIGAGVTGMAETGFIVDSAGKALTPAYSWLTDTGADEMAQLESDFGIPHFSSVTGLSLSTRCSAVKSRWMRSKRKLANSDIHWESLPEWLVSQWGPSHAPELSLAARTGMLDISNRTWDRDLLEWAGFDSTTAQPPKSAGELWGVASVSGSQISDAKLTVAGHDHLCAAVGTGATGHTDVLDSLGTGEAVIRSTSKMTKAAIVYSVESGVSVGIHVLPERMALVAGLGTGARLAKIALALGATATSREQLDAAAQLTQSDPSLSWVCDLIHSGVSPIEPIATGTEARVWRTALDAAAERCNAALTTLGELAGAHERTFATGGWFESRAFREVREELLGPMIIRPDIEASGRGAAMLAGVACGIFSSLDDVPVPLSPATQEEPPL